MWQVLQEFLASFELFGYAYATGGAIAVILGLCGVVLVAQRQVFLGLAVGEASTLGIAVALSLPAGALGAGDDHADLHGLPWVSGVVFAAAASVATAPGRLRRETADAVGAWIFLGGASLSVLLLARSPHGLEEVQRLMFSSLIGAQEVDAALFGALAAAAVASAVTWHRGIVLFATDAETAQAVGLPVRRASVLLAALIGAAIGCTIHSAGTLYSCACLALPATAAKHLCRTMRGLFVVAPVLALASAGVGFVLANHWDLPPAQVAVAVQAAMLVAAWSVAGLRRRRSG
jgi:ABC-type Mn2+/Zn2+ transport system permease subunit